MTDSNQNSREQFYQHISGQNLSPAVGVTAPPGARNAQRYLCASVLESAEIRPLLLKSGSLIGAKEAVRRVLVLENPALGRLPLPRLYMPVCN